MQEPKRINLLQIVETTLEAANRKNFIHRVIYVFPIERATLDSWLNALKNIVKNINDGNSESPLVGLGIFYPNYVINTLEGSEDLIYKHFHHLLNLITEPGNLKILMFLPHVNDQYFAIWRGVIFNPPEVPHWSLPMETPVDQRFVIKESILKLYNLFELLNETSEPDPKRCIQYLLDTLTLNALLSSRLLFSGEDILQQYKSAPDYTAYHQQVWPPPPEFIPKN